MPARSFRVGIGLATALALALPAAASAATIVVDQNAASGCASNTCRTIKDALSITQDGDIVDVRPGAYVEPPLTVANKNLTVQSAPGTVVVTGGSLEPGADVFTITGEGSVLRHLIVNVQENGGQAVEVNTRTSTLENVILVSATKSTQDTPLYLINGAVAGGTNTIRNSLILHTPDLAAPGTAAAVQGNGTSSLLLDGAYILAGQDSGDGVSLPGNDRVGSDDTKPINNQILRSSISAINPGADAVYVSSAADSPRKKGLTVDSSVLAGGQNGSGLKAEAMAASGLFAFSEAGDIDVDMVHATVAGADRAVILNTNANGPGGLNGPPVGPEPRSAGNIDVTVDRAIFHGRALLTNWDGDGQSSPNSVKLTVGRSDISPELQARNAEGGRDQIVLTQNSSNPDAALFVNPAVRNYELRADAPVRDIGGPVLAGESDRDVNGDPRVVGAGSDLGADEFNNKAPLARLKTANLQPRQNTGVIFDASESFDPEAGHGGGIAEYRWDFGDGSTATTPGPTVEHPYANIAAYDVRVSVVDNFGVVSAPSDPLRVTVIDGIAPRISIAQPRANVRWHRYKTRTVRRRVKGQVRVSKRRTPITRRFAGTATDESGVRYVELSFRLVRQTATARKAQSGTCRFLDPKRRSIVGRSCSKPLFFPVSFKDGIWAYRTKRTMRLRPGLYEVTVRATDGSGTQGTTTLQLTWR